MSSRDKATRRRRPATAEKEAAEEAVAEAAEASASPQETSPSDLTSSSSGGASSSSSSSPSMPPLSSSSKSEVIASVMSSSRGAPSALPVSMTAEGTGVTDTGARRRSNAAAAAAAAAARVSLKDYLERNKPADHMEEAEQEEAEKNERERKRERRRRRRSRSRGRSRGGSRSRKSKKSSRSAASDDDEDNYDEEDGRTYYGGANSVFTNSTGLISVREVRKAWGAMFFAAVMGSFVGTGGLHRLLNRHAYGDVHPQHAMMTEARTISRVPPPPSSYSKSHGLRGSMGTSNKAVRPFDLDAEGYEDDIFAAESREQIGAAKAAKSSRAEAVDKKKLPPSSKLAAGGIGDVGLMGGVDEEALRDMEILMGKKVGEGAANSEVGKAETVDLAPSLGADAGEHKKTKNKNKKKKSAVVATQEIPVPVYGGAAIDLDKDPDDENNKDEAEEEESDEESDKEKEEGEEGGAMYAPVSGKRPRRNGDGTIPEALKP